MSADVERAVERALLGRVVTAPETLGRVLEALGETGAIVYGPSVSGLHRFALEDVLAVTRALYQAPTPEVGVVTRAVLEAVQRPVPDDQAEDHHQDVTDGSLWKGLS